MTCRWHMGSGGQSSHAVIASRPPRPDPLPSDEGRSPQMRIHAAVLTTVLLVVASDLGGVQGQTITSSAASVPAFATGSPTPTVTPLPGASGPLFQVASQSWTQGLSGWTPDQTRSWVVRHGVLTSTGKGRKLCDHDEGVRYCRYEALILAPYRVGTTHYAIEAEIRFSDPEGAKAAAGIVFRAHGLSVSPAPLVIIIRMLPDFAHDVGRPSSICQVVTPQVTVV